MDAGKKILLDLFTGSLRFVVPVYQRRYSWGEAQCRQLWADIVTAGRHPDRTHFIGSIVWMQEGGIGPDGVSRCLLIDGQQRLTSVTLLLIALAEYAREHPENLRFSTDMLIDRGYLVDKYATGEGRYKLTLSDDDRDVLQRLCDHCATMRSTPTEYLIRCGPLLLRLGAITGFGGYCVSGPWLLRFEDMAG